MTDYGMPKPKGNPDTIRHAVKNLRAIASDAHKHGGFIGDERTGMRTVWTDSNGDSAAAEAKSLSGLAVTYGKHVGGGATAMSTYAGKLESAQSEVKQLNRDAESAQSEIFADYCRKHSTYPPSAVLELSDYQAAWKEKLGAIQRKYHKVVHDLDLDAYTCANTLTTHTPGAGSHGKPGGVYRAVYNSISASLPALHAHQEAVEYTRIIKDGKIDDSERARAKAIAADLAKHNDDPVYLQQFFNDIPAGSAAKLPEALHNGHPDGPPLSAEDRKIIGQFGTALATVSRVGANASNNYSGRGYDTAAHALGKYEDNMVGIGLLVKYGNGKWNSRMLAEMGEASLRWRQTHHSYEYSMQYGDQVATNGDGKNFDHWWFQDWGLGEGQSAKAFDPALNILGNIVTSHDDWAARKLASDKLPVGLHGDITPKALYRNGKTGTYVDLMVVPDWLDGGSSAGGVLRLATETVRTGAEGRQSALIMKHVIEDTAAWEKNKPKLIDFESKYRGDAPGLGIGPATMLDSRNPHWDHLDLGGGMKKNLAHMAVQYIPTLAADRTTPSGGAPATYVDPFTGQTNILVNGKDATGFMESFVGDEKYRVTFLGAAQDWAKNSIQYGLAHPDLVTPGNVAHRAGWLYGSVANAYDHDETAVSAAGAKVQVEKDLKLSRDLVSTVAGLVPGGGTAVTVGNFAYSHYTDAMFQNYDDSIKAHAEAAEQKSADFGDGLAGEGWNIVAEGVHGTHEYDNVVIDKSSGLTFGQCFDSHGRVIPAHAGQVAVWLQNAHLYGGSDPQTGQDLVTSYEDGFSHNGPN